MQKGGYKFLKNWTGKSVTGEGMNTVCLLVRASLVEVFNVLNINSFYFPKRVTSTWRSVVGSLPLSLVFPAAVNISKVT